MGKDQNLMKKGFNSDPLYNEKYLKTKIKSYGGKTETKLHDERILKEGLHCVCLSEVLIDAAV